MSPKQRTTYGIEYALLGFFQQQPLHGYEVYQRLQTSEAIGLVWRIKQPHFYALLARLEQDGLITGEQMAQETRPPKRLLHLTEAGQAIFEAWIQTPVAHGRELRLDFLAKLFWAQQRGGDFVQRLIEAQRRTCDGWLAELDADTADIGKNHPYSRLVFEFRHSQITAMLAWLDTCTHVLGTARN